MDLSGIDPRRRVDRASYSASDMPEYPARPFLVHLAWKGVEAGAVIGLIATPIYSLVKKVPLGTAWRRAMPAGFIFASTVTGAMTFGKLWKGDLNVEGVDDRGYRLSKSKSQLHADYYSAIGTAAGASAGAILGRYALRSMVAGSLTGAALGVGAHALETMVIPELEKRRAAQQPASATVVAVETAATTAASVTGSHVSAAHGEPGSVAQGTSKQ